MSNKKQIAKNIVSGSKKRAQLQKKISRFLGLDYSIINRSVIINYSKRNKIVNIIVNGDFSSPIDFDLTLLD